MNSTTTLLRQIHPNFIPNGQLTSPAFMPFPKDNGKPSFYDGDQISAADSYKHYTDVIGMKSDSVWGGTGLEVSKVELTYAPDPQDNFLAHAIVNFTSHPERDFRKLAKKLLMCAAARGCLYTPK